MPSDNLLPRLHYQCKCCGQPKHVSEFAYRHTSMCRTCRAIQAKERLLEKVHNIIIQSQQESKKKSRSNKARNGPLWPDSKSGKI